MDVNSLSHTKWNCKYHLVEDVKCHNIYHFLYAKKATTINAGSFSHCNA